MVQEKQNKPFGLQEGIARCISQLCTYPFETGKAQIQVFGHTRQVLCFRGILQSSFTSGVVFGSYFTVYNSLSGNPLASSIAAFTTSVIKIPIANCMRLMQIQNHQHNFLQCGTKIVKQRGIKGLYTGYSVSIAEDIIETNIRNGIYESFKKGVLLSSESPLAMLMGAFAGSFAAGITTPFDTIRANMTYETTKQGKHSIVHTVKHICHTGNKGVLSLYNGVKTRSLSNASRYALFYLILELLEKKVATFDCNIRWSGDKNDNPTH
jgi:hypothetical protein